MNEYSINEIIVSIANKYCKNDTEFIETIKDHLRISEICYMLNINLNRYNYLKRTHKLDTKILELRGK